MPGCCVPECTNHCRQGTRMFRFPASPNRRKRWIAQVKRDHWEPTTASRVCVAHFEDISFEQSRQDGLKKLRPDAVPTLFSYRAIPKHRKLPKKRAWKNAVIPPSPALDGTTSDTDNAGSSQSACAATATLVPLALGVSASGIDSALSRSACAAAATPLPLDPDVTTSGTDSASSKCACVAAATPLPLALDVGASGTDSASSKCACAAPVSWPSSVNDSASFTDGAPRFKRTCAATAILLQPTLDDTASEFNRTAQSLPLVTAGHMDSTIDLDSSLVETTEPSVELASSSTMVQPGGLAIPFAHPLTETIQNETGSSEGQASSAAVFIFRSSATQTLSLIRQENAELRKKNSDLARKYRTLQRLHEQSKSKLRSVTKKITSVHREIEALKTSRFLNKDQTKALSVTSAKGHKWSEKTIRTALQIKHACGTTGYELLRSLSYPLPSNRTLIRRLQNIRFLPGILDEVFQVLKRKAETMQDIEKDCVLFMDEMEISQGFDHDRSLDCLFGSTTLPESPVDVANHALVLMVGGLNTRWKQVIAYHFTGRSTDGSSLKNLVFYLIELCFNISLKVLVVTSDMGAANRAVWRLLGFSSHRHSETICSVRHPHLEGRQLFFMADPAHVLKNIRAQLLRSDTFALGQDTVREHHLPGGTVNIDHVKAVLTYDSDNDLKIANRLSDIHVSSGHFTKMKVNIAVQLFREAPPAIRYLVQQNVLPPEAETTAWFFDLVSRWYTLMSSRHPVVALSHFNAAKHKEAVVTLELACTTFCQMNMGVTAHWKPSQAGLLVSTTVVQRLSDELLNKHGYKYLLTGRLSQDCLENIFSVLRLRKPVPSAYDVKCALKLICVGQFLHTPTSSSYNVDDSVHLADLLDPSLKKQVQDENQESEELENLFLAELTAVECDILAYVGGFLLRSLIKSIGNCNDCKGALVSVGTDQYSSLIHLKEYVKSAGNLIHPSQTVMSVLIECEENFKAFAELDAILTLKAPFASILNFLRKSVRVQLGCCDMHKARVEKVLLEKYVRTRLMIHLRQQHTQAVSGASSKTCAAANLK